MHTKIALPEPILCFIVGFFSTGVWIALLSISVDGLFSAFDPSYELPIQNFTQPFFMYGIEGGLVGAMVALVFGRFVPQSLKHRETWMMIGVPQISFYLAGFTVTVLNAVNSKTSFLKLIPRLISLNEMTAIYSAVAGVCSLVVIIALWLIRSHECQNSP
ncbi:MAG: hypothetical protein U0103_00110 [Candidatus Obscuribacterales bacterium]